VDARHLRITALGIPRITKQTNIKVFYVKCICERFFFSSRRANKHREPTATTYLRYVSRIHQSLRILFATDYFGTVACLAQSPRMPNGHFVRISIASLKSHGSLTLLPRASSLFCRCRVSNDSATDAYDTLTIRRSRSHGVQRRRV
jgi:hypothetical protein